MTKDDLGPLPRRLSDPSLEAGPAEGEFPDTTEGTYLVLYQTGDGGVELRWQIEPAAFAHARDAFSNPLAHPVLRLSLTGPGGAGRVLANADLGDDAAATQGLARYAGSDAEGLLRAEIGITTDDGGWMLVARSNELAAAAPVGVAFLRETGSGAGMRSGLAERPVDDVPATWLSEGGERGAYDGAEFPFVEPVFSGLDGGPAPLGFDAGVGVPNGAQPQPREQAIAGPGSNDDGRSLDAPASGGGPPGGPPGGPTEPAAGEAPAHASNATPANRPEPPPGGVVPRLDRAQHQVPRPQSGEPASVSPADTEQSIGSGQGRAVSLTAGSGPVHRGAADASLHAELLVHGSAPPNTVLDLGGHAYRVGPGGRFEMRIPVQDRDLILRLLAALPRLPVEDRDGDQD